ncbi:MAG: nucleotide pyrophosphohydrolase [Anaerolineae bacterium]|nr:nucleotide pyrophosphohydrolase [Anaerolineae bacterium]
MEDTSRDAQCRVAAFLAVHDLQAPLAERLLDLVSEVGELSKTMLNASDYGRVPFAVTEAWREELGDVAFSLLSVAVASEVDLAEALDAALDKMTRRIAESGDAASGR